MKTLILVALTAAGLTIALPAAASAYDPRDPYQWTYHQPGSAPDILWNRAATTLRGRQPRSTLALLYEKRRWGINLGWDTAYNDATGRWQWALVKPETFPNVIRHGDRVALYNVKARASVVYGKRRFGINLAWSKPRTAVRQWVVRRRGDRLALYNVVARDYIVYGEREYGVNLRWRRDLADVRDHRTG